MRSTFKKKCKGFANGSEYKNGVTIYNNEEYCRISRLEIEADLSGKVLAFDAY
jgi:hypothetical protein